ncbi:unnamed protein product, partial [Adineta ricciae]
MLEHVIESTIEEELSKEKQAVYEKLANIFDPETAISYVCPKTNEIRDNTTLEDLKLLDSNKQRAYLERLRQLVHYKTTTQPLSRVDLE